MFRLILRFCTRSSLACVFFAHYIDEHEITAPRARFTPEKKVAINLLGGSVGREDALGLPHPFVYATLDAHTVRADNVFSVSVDDRAAAYAAADYLLMRGHRNIAVLGGRLDAENPIALRYRGVADAFAAHGLVFPREHYLPAGFSLAAAHAAMDAALSAGLDCTAVFAMSDIMRSAQRAHLRIMVFPSRATSRSSALTGSPSPSTRSPRSPRCARAPKPLRRKAPLCFPAGSPACPAHTM